MRCVDIIKKRAHLTDQEAQALLDRIVDFRDEHGGKYDWATMGREIEAFALKESEAEIARAIQTRREAVIDATKRNATSQRVDKLSESGMRPDKAIRAEVFAVANDQAGLEAFYSAPIIQMMEKDKELTDLLLNDRDFNRSIIDELESPGAGKDEKVKSVAAVMAQMMEHMRQSAVDNGAAIGKILDGYIPHKHNACRISADPAGFHASLVENLDWEKSFKGFEKIPPKKVADFQAKAVQAIKNSLLRGGDINIDIRPFLKTGKRAASALEHRRELIFKAGEGWINYNDKFGEGSVLAGYFDHVEKMSIRIAMMQRWGTKPESTLQNIISLKMHELSATPAGVDKKVDKAIAKLREQDIIRGHGSIGIAFQSVSGADRVPVNFTLARIGSFARHWTSMTKLGGAVISAISDVPVAAMHLRNAYGLNFMEAWGENLSGFFAKIPPELREDFRGLIDCFSDAIRGRIGARFDGPNNLNGFMSKAAEKFFKWSGLTFWTDNYRAGAVAMISHALGRNADKSLAQLGPEFLHTLKKYGLDEHWDVIRTHMTKKGSDGRLYVIPEMARGIPKDVIDGLIAKDVADMRKKAEFGIDLNPAIEAMRREAWDRINTAVHGFMAAEVDKIVLNPTARTTATMYQGTRRGTIKGEALRTIMQFKSFPVAFIQEVMMPMIAGHPGQSGWSRAGNVALMTAQLTAFGFVAMNIKRLARGETLDYETADWKQIAMASFLQGGAAGLYGDFLLGQTNRFDNSFIESLAGPTLGGPIADIQKLWGLGIQGELKAADFVRAAVNNTPFINMSYTRAILDYGIIHNINEKLNPGYNRTREKKMEKKGGWKYQFPPSEYRWKWGPFE